MSKTTHKPQLQCHIRWMIRRDLDDVIRIERAAFSEFNWQEEDFVRHLRQRNCIGMTTEVDFAGQPKVVGFMLYELHRDRLVVLNFAVDPRFHRNGIGTAMVEKLKYKMSPGRRGCIALECRESNLEALNFFKAQGFQAVKLMREYYEECNEDAVLMRFQLQRQPERELDRFGNAY